MNGLKKLKDSIRLEAIALGVTLKDFENNWPSFVEDSEDSDDIIDRWNGYKESFNLEVKS